jgi:cytoskeletal protein CcmA (bactofilin family)
MALFNRDTKDRSYGEAQASGSLGESTHREVVMAEQGRSAAQFAGAGGMDAFLGKGTKITGKLVFEGPGRIEGQVEGEIAAQDVLTVGEGALVNAKVAGTTIVIEGQVTGDVTAKTRLELRSSARVNGNVSAPSLVMHEGAVLNGQCSMTPGEKPKHNDKTEPATKILDQTRDSSMQVASSFRPQ